MVYIPVPARPDGNGGNGKGGSNNPPPTNATSPEHTTPATNATSGGDNTFSTSATSGAYNTQTTDTTPEQHNTSFTNNTHQIIGAIGGRLAAVPIDESTTDKGIDQSIGEIDVSEPLKSHHQEMESSAIGMNSQADLEDSSNQENSQETGYLKSEVTKGYCTAGSQKSEVKSQENQVNNSEFRIPNSEFESSRQFTNFTNPENETIENTNGSAIGEKVGATEHSPIISKEVPNESPQNVEISYEDVINGTNAEIKRVGGTKRRWESYLRSKYGKKSRQLLSDRQLLEFWDYLKGLPDNSYPTKETLAELKALLVACETFAELTKVEKQHPKEDVKEAYSELTLEQQHKIDGIRATAVKYEVYKYLGGDVKEGDRQLFNGDLVYIDPNANPDDYHVPVLVVGVKKAWKAAITVSRVCLSLVEKVAQDAADLIDGSSSDSSSEVCDQPDLFGFA